MLRTLLLNCSQPVVALHVGTGSLILCPVSGAVRKQMDVAVLPAATRMPSRPGEFHPEPLTDPDVNLSIHPARVTARRLPPSADALGSSQFDPVGPSQRR